MLLCKNVGSSTGKGPIPINLDAKDWPCGIEFLREDSWRKDFATEEEFLEVVPYSIINNWCPFCGKNVSGDRRRRRDPKYSHDLCGGFMFWFDPNDLSRECGMIEYDHRNNQFYLHNRKGFGEGYTAIILWGASCCNGRKIWTS